MSKKDHRSVLCFSCEELQRKYAGCRLGVRLQCSISVRAEERLQRDTWARLWSTNVCLWKQMVGEMSPGGHWDRSKKGGVGKKMGRTREGSKENQIQVSVSYYYSWEQGAAWLTLSVLLTNFHCETLQNETSFFFVMIWLNAGWTIGTWHISINNENIDRGWEHHRGWLTSVTDGIWQ